MKGRVWFELGLLVVLAGAVFGSTLAVSRKSDYAFMDPIIDVHHLLKEKFVDEVDQEKLRQGAIRGMVEALDDPYTVYVPPSDSAEFTKQLTGEYVGIGAQVDLEDGWLKIVSPLEDSPAFRAGLMADDRVVEIGGTSTHNVGVDKCIELLMGDPGTTVTLTIERLGEKLPVTITREKIKTRSVKGYKREERDGNKWMYMLDPTRKIAYVRLTQFTPRCAEELAAALESCGASSGGVKGLVLDLRNNPGGVLSDAVAIADLFLKEGTIVSTRGRAHKEETARARSEGTLPEFPIAILLNGFSASASEVLAGALVENNRAIVVGTRSFGKGSVQTVHVLESQEGAEVKLTEQGYFLPSGRSITRKDEAAQWGVDPSEGFFVPISDDETRQMFEVRRSLEVLHQNAKVKGDEQWTNPEWVLDALKDKQLVAAVRAVQGRVDSGAWTPTGEAGPAGQKIAVNELQRLTQARQRIERELIRMEKRIDALESVGVAGAGGERDLIPDDAVLAGGQMTITDKAGKTIAVLELTGNGLERWLIDADVRKKAGADNPSKGEPAKSEPRP